MLKKLAIVLLAASFGAGFFGCSKNTTHTLLPESQLDRNWGRSFEAAKYNQILNPETEKNLAPVEGLEGQAAERILEGYRRGGDQKEQKRPSGYGFITVQPQ